MSIDWTPYKINLDLPDISHFRVAFLRNKKKLQVLGAIRLIGDAFINKDRHYSTKDIAFKGWLLQLLIIVRSDYDFYSYLTVNTFKNFEYSSKLLWLWIKTIQ